jgi:RNA polymerase sigma-70 factor (ECF subfamily)
MAEESSSSHTSVTLLGQLCRAPADPRAWDEFVRRYRPRIVGWCVQRGLQGADAEDVAQIVLSKLIDVMRNFRYDPSRSFRAWLKTVTMRACHDLVTGPNRALESLDARVQRALDEPEAREELAQRIHEEYDRELLDLAVERVRASVAPLTWQSFQLTGFEGCTGAEAASRLGIPIANVFTAKHRVVKMLRAAIRALENRDEQL